MSAESASCSPDVATPFHQGGGELIERFIVLSICRLRLNVGNIQFSSENHDTKLRGMFLTLAINESRSIEPSVYSISAGWPMGVRFDAVHVVGYARRALIRSPMTGRGVGTACCSCFFYLCLTRRPVFQFFPENSSATRLLPPLRRLIGAKSAHFSS